MEFIEAPPFTRHLPDYLNDEDYRELQARLGANPEFGELMPGTYTAAYKLGLLGGGSALVEVETILPDAGTPITPTVADSPAPFAALVADATASEAPIAAPLAAEPVASAPASSEQGSRLRDANVRESGTAPSSAGVASVSGVTSPKEPARICCRDLLALAGRVTATLFPDRLPIIA